MSLNSTIAQGVQTAFAAAGDLVVLGTYVARTGTPVYNASTDTYTAPTVTHTNVRMLRTSLTDEEREASPTTVSDIKVLIPATDLPGTRPSETDTFTVENVGYNVLRIKTVPGDSLWILFARAK